MVDETTPFTADFGLIYPLPANPDQGLSLSASARWEECCEQWLSLMAQSSQAHLDNAWWSARALGTDHSRREQAIRLYRQHFEVSSQWAFAQGILDAGQIKTLLALIDPPAQTPTPTPDQHPVYVEQLNLNDDNGLSTPHARPPTTAGRTTMRPEIRFVKKMQHPWKNTKTQNPSRARV